MSNHPTTTIIVLNWNGRSYLKACLDALLDQTHKADHIVLVDNGSTDDSLELVQEHFPSVEILRNEINLGYAGGNNKALRRLESEIGILVNPDIVVRPDWLANLLSVFAEDTAVGIAGCKLLFPGEQQLQHAGGLITHPRAMPHHRGMYSSDEWQFNDPTDVDFVTGAALAVRKELLEKTGLLDEGFFMYFEDADWCTRARRSGFRVVYVPGATAVHDESAIAVRGSPSYLRRFHHGRWRYLLKHFSAEELIEETLPTEQAWLAKIEGPERPALGWAYRTALDTFPEIMKTRLTHGAEEITTTDQAAIKAGLLDLRRQAMLWTKNPGDWQHLEEVGRIEPQPFSGSTPLLGPLFARLRDIWASVSTKYYVGSLNDQQNAFNQAFVEELQVIEEKLRALEIDWMQREADQRELSWEIRAVQQELNKTYGLIAQLESRFAKSAQSNDPLDL
jgi:GT2 family glycosyltransferase